MEKNKNNWAEQVHPFYEEAYIKKIETSKKRNRYFLVIAIAVGTIALVIFFLWAEGNRRISELGKDFNAVYIEITAIFDETNEYGKIVKELNTEENRQKMEELSAIIPKMNKIAKWLNQRRMRDSYAEQYIVLEAVKKGTKSEDYFKLIQYSRTYREACKLGWNDFYRMR